MKNKTIYSVIREALDGERKFIQIGRSFNSAAFGTNTPIQYIAGNSPPKLLGKPYLKTQFKNKNFSKTLYTPSTLYVEVGCEWIANQIGIWG